MSMTRAVVWLVLLLTLCSSLSLVAVYGDELPRSDEWVDTNVILGDEPFEAAWLWQVHNVHRAPISRGLRLAFYRMTDSFRTALFFNVLVMGLAAALLLVAVERCRGASSLFDVLIPLLLVGPAHYKNFFWGFQVAFALSCSLFVATLAMLVTAPRQPGARRLAAIAGCQFLQVLTGANGIAFAAPLLAWTTFALVFGGRDDPRWRRLAMALVAVSAVVIALYPIGLVTVTGTFDALASLGTTLAFYGTAFGAESFFWRFKSLVVVAAALGVIPLLLQVVARDRGTQIWRASGLAAALASALLIGDFVGIGRSTMGVQPRYATLAVALPCVTYVVCAVYAKGFVRRLIPIALLALVVPFTMLNGVIAVRFGQVRQEQTRQIRSDAALGLPPRAIAARSGSAIHPSVETAADVIVRLAKHAAWPFEDYREDTQIESRFGRQHTVVPEWKVLRDARSDRAGFVVVGARPTLEVRLPQPLSLAAIDLVFAVDRVNEGVPFVTVRWDEAGAGDPFFDTWARSATNSVGLSRETHVRIWVYDVVDTIRIETTRVTSRFELRNVRLLELPENWHQEAAVEPDRSESP